MNNLYSLTLYIVCKKRCTQFHSFQTFKILYDVNLLYDVNYTNPENGLKNAHLDRTSNPSKRNFLRYREGFPISHISGATRFYGSA